MKVNSSSLWIAIVAVCLLVLIAVLPRSGMARSLIAQPTPAPETETTVEGHSQQQPFVVTIPLSEPLKSADEALTMALTYDETWAVWRESDTRDGLQTTSENVEIIEYPSRTSEATARGESSWFHPELEKDAGSVWSVTIMGPVRLGLIGGDPERVVDGVNYVVSARTGNLLAIREIILSDDK